MKRTRLKLKSIPICFSITFTCLHLMSCGENSEGGDLFTNVAEIFESGISTDILKQSLDSNLSSFQSNKDSIIVAQVRSVYEGNDYSLVWHEDKRVTSSAKKALASFDMLHNDGLDPSKYESQQLQSLFENKQSTDKEIADRDVMLTLNLAKAAYDLTFGTLNPSEIDKEWHSDNDSIWLFAQKLGADASGKDDFLNLFRPQHSRYQIFRDELAKWDKLKVDSNYLSKKEIVAHSTHQDLIAIMQAEMGLTDMDSTLIETYQYRNQIAVSGKIDEATKLVLQKKPEEYISSLKINMERMRWLPNELQLDHYIWVSIPQAEVDYYKDGNNIFHTRSIVGSKTNRTPSISKPMKNIVICPPWGLPHSIVKSDYNGRIPAKYEVFKGGKKVPNSMVNASNYKQFTVRQPPGPSAALGYVKFNLPNKWDIYLHDTPNRSLFGNKNRYLSHGCVRVKDPRVLASMILADKGLTVDSINTLISKNKTVYINTGNIPVYINYFTTNADSNLTNVIYLNDPYNKDSVLRSKLLSM